MRISKHRHVAVLVTCGALGALACSDVEPGTAPLHAAPSATTTTPPTPPPTPPTPSPIPTAPPTTTTTTPTPPTPTTTAVTPTPPPEPTPRDQLPALFAEPVRTARAAPISGGTLLVTADGTAVAVDADRDQVFLVDLATKAVRAVAVDAGTEPGRVVEGPPGTVFVAARRGGFVLAIDVPTATVTGRYPVCNAPRGMAYDTANGRLHVACRSGRLVSLDAATGAVVSTFELEDDLRDVLIVNGSLVVTRFRSAELLLLDEAGAISKRSAPPTVGPSVASVAFRSVGLPNGTVAMAHQVESTNQLGTGFGAYYGGGCSGGGVVEQVVSVAALGSTLFSPVNQGEFLRAASLPTAPFPIVSQVVGGALGPLDIAVSRDGARMAVVASGNSWQVAGELPTLYVTALDTTTSDPPIELGNGTCSGASAFAHYLPGEPVAVAFDGSGRYVVQSREPAMLELEGDVFITLSEDSRFDTGFAMFHLNSSGGISCASCHPEGGEDGHVWSFSGVGLRRSQALEGGVGSRTPFHWSGDLSTFDALFGEVMLKRMALPVVPPVEDVSALATWLETIPALPPADALDPALVERGRALFFDSIVDCGSCHSGPAYTDHRLYDVGTGGEFVTPSLLGVGLRAPLLHDGCAASLHARFGVCGGDAHGDVSALTESDLDALVTFMRSL